MIKLLRRFVGQMGRTFGGQEIAIPGGLVVDHDVLTAIKQIKIAIFGPNYGHKEDPWGYKGEEEILLYDVSGDMPIGYDLHQLVPKAIYNHALACSSYFSYGGVIEGNRANFTIRCKQLAKFRDKCSEEVYLRDHHTQELFSLLEWEIGRASCRERV